MFRTAASPHKNNVERAKRFPLGAAAFPVAGPHISLSCNCMHKEQTVSGKTCKTGKANACDLCKWQVSLTPTMRLFYKQQTCIIENTRALLMKHYLFSIN